jgi:hypothetical protein
MPFFRFEGLSSKPEWLADTCYHVQLHSLEVDWLSEFYLNKASALIGSSLPL